jgi:hypothetical protein
MLRFKDFVPRQISPPAFLKPAEYDTIDAAAEDAAVWIETAGVKLVHVETVVLPNVHSEHEEGSHDASILTSGKMYSSWHQFVRVWYEE